MKRILPLILTVLILVSQLAVPAMADESTPWINILDFSTVNDSGNNYYYLYSGTNRFYYNLPSKCVIRQIDIIVSSTQPILEVSVCRSNVADGSSDWFALTVISLGDNLYRIYGELNFTYAWSQIWLHITVDSNSYLQLYKLDIATAAFAYDFLNADGYVRDYSNSSMEYYIFHTSVQDYNIPEWTTGTGSGNGGWAATFDIVHDNKYDYVQVCINTYSNAVNSIQVLLGGQAVPFSTNFIESVGDYLTARYTVVIDIDLTNISRSVLYDLEITVTGTGAAGRTNNFSIPYVWGFFEFNSPSPLVYYFNLLKTWLSSLAESVTSSIALWGQNIINALGGSNDASQVQDHINAAVGELQQAGAALDAVDRPDIGSVNIDVVGMIDPVGLTGVASIVSLFTENSMIYSIMIMSLTLALISYILFGKG